jgi:hypothetical protein
MCARLWWDEPLVAARHRLALFASFSLTQIEVVRDPAAAKHVDTVKRASAAGVPVIEVDQ